MLNGKCQRRACQHQENNKDPSPLTPSSPKEMYDEACGGSEAGPLIRGASPNDLVQQMMALQLKMMEEQGGIMVDDYLVDQGDPSCAEYTDDNMDSETPDILPHQNFSAISIDTPRETDLPEWIRTRHQHSTNGLPNGIPYLDLTLQNLRTSRESATRLKPNPGQNIFSFIQGVLGIMNRQFMIMYEATFWTPAGEEVPVSQLFMIEVDENGAIHIMSDIEGVWNQVTVLQSADDFIGSVLGNTFDPELHYLEVYIFEHNH